MLLPLLQRASRLSSAQRSCLRVHLSLDTCRSISATSIRWTSIAPEPPTPEEEAELAAASFDSAAEGDPLKEDQTGDASEERPDQSMTYNVFLSTTGAKFKRAKPRNWLGGTVPFPMNPSFKPPPPLPDAVRQDIYNAFMSDPETNNIRRLSQRYQLSLKRVEAILRLKGLEHSWHKNKPIQYGFQKGMEKLLGVKSHDRTYEEFIRDKSRWDFAEADSLEQDENRDAQRQRYQRHYWESVPEDGREPIVPASVEHAKNVAQRLVKYEEHQKSTHPRLMPKFPDNKRIRTPPNSQTLKKRGRATLEIQDVGGKFLDLNDRLKRITVAEQRAREKEKQREKRKGPILHARP